MISPWDMAAYRYWQHFLALEADFAATSRYVEFAEPNFKTYSTEFTKLLLAIGSEVDVLCKIICYNIYVLIQETHELGIDVEFRAK